MAGLFILIFYMKKKSYYQEMYSLVQSTANLSSISIIDWNNKSLFIKYQSIFIVTIHLFLFLIIGILFLQSFFLLFIWTQALCNHYHSPPGLDFCSRISLNYFLLLDFLNIVYLFHSFINELFSLSVTFSKE